jgi:hypothetical protein
MSIDAALAANASSMLPRGDIDRLDVILYVVALCIALRFRAGDRHRRTAVPSANLFRF